MVIVTGANSDYFHGLENLVGSIHYWMPKTSVAIFNLGLDPQQLAHIAAWRNCDLRWAADGPPEDLLVNGDWKHCAHMSQPKKLYLFTASPARHRPPPESRRSVAAQPLVAAAAPDGREDTHK